jgi:hypothetical protein
MSQSKLKAVNQFRSCNSDPRVGTGVDRSEGVLEERMSWKLRVRRIYEEGEHVRMYTHAR